MDTELKQEIANVEKKFKGVPEHLAAARDLANQGLEAKRIRFMMRYNFSKQDVGVLIAEAAYRRQLSASKG